jgi:hypothetical protein
MNLTNRRRFIYSLIGLSIFASLLLTLIFREQIRTGLVTPVSYAAWYINVILTTVPQPIFWAVLVFGGLYIAGRSLLKNLPTPDDPPEIPYSGHSVSRFQYWNWYLSSFQISQFSSEHMSRNLARFLLEILAFQEHQTIDQVEERVLTNQIELPEEISSLIKTRRLIVNLPNPTPLSRFIDRFIRRKPQVPPSQIENSEAREKIIRIIQFVEERLEIQHEPIH